MENEKLVDLSLEDLKREIKKMIEENEEEKKKVNSLFSSDSIKKYLGTIITVFGAISYIFSSFQEASIEKFIDFILGSLFIVMGIGILMLSKVEKNKDSLDSVNGYMGKKFFETGLQGIVIGVIGGMVAVLYK